MQTRFQDPAVWDISSDEEGDPHTSGAYGGLPQVIEALKAMRLTLGLYSISSFKHHKPLGLGMYRFVKQRNIGCAVLHRITFPPQTLHGTHMYIYLRTKL